MNKSQEIKALLSSFFQQLSAEQMEQARAITGIGYLPRGTLHHLLDDQKYSLDDLVTFLLAESVHRQEELRLKSERIAELETFCAQQQRAIDDIANQSLKLRALIDRINPDSSDFSSFDVLKGIAKRVEGDQA